MWIGFVELLPYEAKLCLPTREVPKTRGQSGSELLVFACPDVSLESRIPLLGLLSVRAVEGARPRLQYEPRTRLRPPHLLTFAEAFAYNRVDGAFHEPSGDIFAVAPPVAKFQRGQHAQVEHA